MSSPVLKGQVVYEDHGGSIWGKIGSILSGAGHVIASALPYVAQAASIYASSRGGLFNVSDYNGVSWESPTQFSQRNLPMPIPELTSLHPIPDYKSEPIARNALDKLKPQQEYKQLSASNWPEMQARNQQILNELAAAKGLPNYQQFHQDNGVTYDFQLNPSQLGVDRLLQPSRQSNGFIQEDDWQIAQNLSHARRPVSMALNRQPIQSQVTGTRATNESPVLHQVTKHSNTVKVTQKPQPKIEQPKATTFHDKQYLNTRQQLLNNLFNSKIFDQVDRQAPYDLKNGQKVDDPNVARMTAVANWILSRSKSSQWTDFQIQQLQNTLQYGRDNKLSLQQIRQLDMAAQLHSILKNNEELPSFQRDDAKTFSQGMRVLIEANTLKGKVNEPQLIEDMKFFMIDQGNDPPLGMIINQITEFRPSNAAYNLLGGPRLGTVGWNKKYWDHGQLFDANGKPINQAHHFAASFIDSFRHGSKEAWNRVKVLDGGKIPGLAKNAQDLELSKIAIQLAKDVKEQRITWQKLPENIYKELKN